MNSNVHNGLLCLLLINLTACVSHSGVYSEAERAAQLRQEGKLDQAIKAYEEHIQDRLGNPHRPESENPYFYYIYIADILREQGKDKEALAATLMAKDQGVERSLVVSRARQLGKWYEEQGRFDDAIAVLSQFRTLDPLMIDLDIDRIHKELVEREDR